VTAATLALELSLSTSGTQWHSVTVIVKVRADPSPYCTALKRWTHWVWQAALPTQRLSCTADAKVCQDLPSQPLTVSGPQQAASRWPQHTAAQASAWGSRLGQLQVVWHAGTVL